MKLLPVAFLGAVSAATFVLFACGSSTNEAAQSPAPPAATTPAAVDEAGAPSTPSGYPGAHMTAPSVTNLGGPTLASPVLVPIFYSGFGYHDQLIDFASKIGKSAYWKAVGAEYGVGVATSATAIDVAEDAPATITDAQIKAWLQSRFDGTHPEFGDKPIDGAIYTLFYPPTTTIYLTGGPPDGGVPEAGAGDGGDGGGGGKGHGGQTSCKSFGGYHDDVTVNGVMTSYAVIPQCATFGPLTGLDVVTGTPSHEWIEAATDPFPVDNPAYATIDEQHLIWTYVLGAGEVADMCAQYDTSFYKDPEIGYTVQRSWSNAGSLAGHEPCVPAPATEGPYFNSVPVLTDDVSLQIGVTKGVNIPVGQSKTIDLQLYSDGPTTGPWDVQIEQESSGASGATPPLSFSLDKQSGSNGDTLKLTITANAATTSRLGGSPFIIVSSLGDNKYYWAGVVGN